MKAVVVHEYGGPDVLKYKEVANAKPGRGEVLIQVKATSINHVDIFLRRGMPGVKVAMPDRPVVAEEEAKGEDV